MGKLHKCNVWSGKWIHRCVISAFLFASSQLSYSQVQSGLDASQIYKKSAPAVVLIETYDQKDELHRVGSGFLVSADGKILTNYHVIAHSKKATVKLANGDAYDSVDVIDIDKRKDIAVVRIRAVELPHLDLGRSSAVEIGEKLFCLGNPLGFVKNALSEGIVSTVKLGDGYRYFIISAPISPGSSGGPVLNSKGEVIAIATGSFEEGQNLNVAIPIDYAKGMLASTQLLHLADIYEPEPSSPARRQPDSGSKPTGSIEPGASLQETISWLTAKLEGLSNYLPSGFHVRIERLSFAGSGTRCNMDLTASWEKDSIKVVSKYSPFLNLAEKSLAGQNKDGDWGVLLQFGQNVYRSNESYDQGTLTKREEERTNVIPLFTGDEDLARHASQAFNRVIQLCGGGAKTDSETTAISSSAARSGDAAELAGTYTGTWESDTYNVSGVLVLTMALEGGQMTARIALTGSDYLNQDMLIFNLTPMGSGVWKMDYKGKKSKVTGTGIFRGGRFVGDYHFSKFLWSDRGRWVLQK